MLGITHPIIKTSWRRLELSLPRRPPSWLCLADWAKVAPDVAKWLSLGFAGNSNFIRVLKESSKSFVERADRLFIRSFYETEKYGNLIVSFTTIRKHSPYRDG